MENGQPRILESKKIKLEELKLYPKDYQFRLGANGNGVAASHEIKDENWDSLKHGAAILVHHRKDKDGNWEYAVVDGHHRVNFAKKLAAQGKGPTELDAYVLEEEQVNTKTAKVLAGLIDISRGETNVGDAAAVIKESLETGVNDKVFPELQPVGNLPKAYKLASLNYGSLAKISKGEVPVEAAEMVVDKVKDPRKRDRVIEIIGVKLKQGYPNYKANTELATVLSTKANDNQKSFLDKLKEQRVQAGTSKGMTL